MTLLIPAESSIVDYNGVVIGEETQRRERAQVEFWIAKQLGTSLARVYPNRQWRVNVDSANEIIVVGCDSVSMEKGYHIHMRNRNIHELQQRAIKAAGEILERHNISRRNAFNPEHLETLKRDVRDNVIAPDAAPVSYGKGSNA